MLMVIDPMVDLGYFLMMFLQAAEYHRCGHLQNIGLLMGEAAHLLQHALYIASVFTPNKGHFIHI